LTAFAAGYPQTKACLLHGSRDRLRIDGILRLPHQESLREIVLGKLPDMA
jgi:hypothetical protein